MKNNNSSMINPSIVDLLNKVENRYSLVVAASKRARQIIDGSEPLIETESTKPVTIAIKEINQDALLSESQDVKEGLK
ncbi:DNA-directed RNA polymerase subunit omega [Clostridium senegalense]|uniref:DNA-directed RNA polymerase subunit omega n=1 Tax=Clostridium senegalense TaxID=1465809 RepID=UPI0002893BD7|nr:DNA-directed RNA polymerase subunit omega [Clostridium senegalense]MBU5225601.1 DNA-directed RNA polymerase subunit omega [Clostridium senegalense]